LEKSILPTAYISHEDCHGHDTPSWHPENARRLSAIEDALAATQLFDFLHHERAPEVTQTQLARVHQADYLAAVVAAQPAEGYAYLDPDTIIGPGSLAAARRAAGAVVRGVDLVMAGVVNNAFCAVRPPGHHAESACAMGYCIYNNVAVGAAHALAEHGLQRVAILDFDVHHGNGTEQIFRHDRRVTFCSTFQHPFYPNTPLIEPDNRLLSIPLSATAKGPEFRDAVEYHWLPALDSFRPEMIFVSAGFDAHRDDDTSGVSLSDADYRWVSEQIVAAAAGTASGRVVSVLEGGYEHYSLGRCVAAHVRVLMGL
jgi:acetoin utilization deacetylase AcuC-like enzyme